MLLEMQDFDFFPNLIKFYPIYPNLPKFYPNFAQICLKNLLSYAIVNLSFLLA